MRQEVRLAAVSYRGVYATVRFYDKKVVPLSSSGKNLRVSRSNYPTKRLFAQAGISAGMRVLELCCGPGEVTEVFSSAGLEFDGIWAEAVIEGQGEQYGFVLVVERLKTLQELSDPEGKR